MKKGYLNGIPFFMACSWRKVIPPTFPSFNLKLFEEEKLIPKDFLYFPAGECTFSPRETYVSATGNIRFQAGKRKRATDILRITCSHSTNSLL